MKTLTLPVIKRWFVLQEQGIKTEEYRRISDYWIRRLLKSNGGAFTALEWVYYYEAKEAITKAEAVILLLDRGTIKWKHFDQTKVTLGYPRHGFTDRILTFEHLGIEIGYGKPEWGAIEGELYFVIKHGKINQ